MPCAIRIRRLLTQLKCVVMFLMCVASDTSLRAETTACLRLTQEQAKTSERGICAKVIDYDCLLMDTGRKVKLHEIKMSFQSGHIVPELITRRDHPRELRDLLIVSLRSWVEGKTVYVLNARVYDDVQRNRVEKAERNRRLSAGEELGTHFGVLGGNDRGLMPVCGCLHERRSLC